jgi:hypothetical protein
MSPTSPVAALPDIRLLPPPPDPVPHPPAPAPGQQPLPLDFVLPSGLSAAAPPVPASARTRPGIAPWAARLAQAVLEVEAAERTRPRRPEQVRSVHVCQPTPDVAEVSVVTSGGTRCRALALRLEHRRGRWLCTALDWA